MAPVVAVDGDEEMAAPMAFSVPATISEVAWPLSEADALTVGAGFMPAAWRWIVLRPAALPGIWY